MLCNLSYTWSLEMSHFEDPCFLAQSWKGLSLWLGFWVSMPSVQPSTEVENMRPNTAFRCHFEKVAQDCVKKRTWKGSYTTIVILKTSLIVLCLPFTPCQIGLQKYTSQLWSFSLAQSAFEKSSTIPGTLCLLKYMPIKQEASTTTLPIPSKAWTSEPCGHQSILDQVKWQKSYNFVG